MLAAEFVNTADGTGIVHMSPAHGEDDKQACDAAGIPTIVCLDRSGRFLPIVADFAGMFWQEANLSIIKSLKQKHDLFSQKAIPIPILTAIGAKIHLYTWQYLAGLYR